MEYKKNDLLTVTIEDMGMTGKESEKWTVIPYL